MKLIIDGAKYIWVLSALHLARPRHASLAVQQDGSAFRDLMPDALTSAPGKVHMHHIWKQSWTARLGKAGCATSSRAFHAER